MAADNLAKDNLAKDRQHDETATDQPPQLPPIVSDAQLRKLKVAVSVMGIVLLAGFALVIGRIVYLLNRPAVDPSQAATSIPAAPITAADVRLALPAGAVVRHLSLSGNRLAVHYDSPTGAAIAIVDLGLGRAVQRIELAPSGAR